MAIIGHIYFHLDGNFPSFLKKKSRKSLLACFTMSKLLLTDFSNEKLLLFSAGQTRITEFAKQEFAFSNAKTRTWKNSITS